MYSYLHYNIILYVKHLYKRVRFWATFGLCIIIISYRTHQYEHIEENNMSIAPLITEI